MAKITFFALTSIPLLASAENKTENNDGTDTWRANAPFDWVSSQFEKLDEDYGLKPKLSYEATVLGNPSGGISRTMAYSHLLDFGMTFDLDKIAGLKGSSFVISARHGAGRDMRPYIGNLFNVSEADVPYGVNLTGLYWQQSFAEDAVLLQVGRLNSSAFAKLPAFGLQVSGGVDGNPASLGMNSNFTSSSRQTWGSRMFVKPEESYYFSGGLYQASNSIGKVSSTDFSIRRGDRLLFIAETGWTPVFGEQDTADKATGLNGHYTVGAYYSNLSRERFDLGGSVNDIYGFYLMGQQTIWRSEKNPDNNVALWGGLTYAPQTEVAKMPLMGFAGFVWQGLVPGRNQDKLLGAVLVGSLSSDYADSVAGGTYGRPGNTEVVLDFSYIIRLSRQVFIQPDIQYVMNPGGYDTIADALVIGMQFGISF